MKGLIFCYFLFFQDIPVEERVGQSARVDIPSIITFRSLEESANEQELGVSSVNERSFENPTYGQDIDAEKLFAKVTVVPQREDAKDKKTQPHSFDNPMYDQRPNGTKSETEKEKIVESNFEQEQSSLNILVDLEASQKAEIPAKERGNSTTTHGLTTDPMSEEVSDNADEDQQTPPGSMISPSNAEISGLPFTKETPIGSRSESPFMASMSCLQPQSSAKTSPVVSRPQTPSRFLASLLPQQPPPPLTSPSVPVSASNKVIDADDSAKEDGATMSFTANEQEDGFCRTPFQPEKKSHSLDATKVDHGTASDASVQSQAEEYFPVTHGLDEKTPKREEKRDISIFRGDEETHQGQKNLFSEDPAPTQDGESRKMTSAGAAITCENLTQEPGDLQSEGKEAKPRILTRVEGPSSDESDEEIKKETLPTSEP